MALRLVKKTDSGKVKVMLSPSVKPLLRYLFEEGIETLFQDDEVDMRWVAQLMHKAVLQDLYVKYLIELSLENRKSKLLLTRAQALALWWLGQELKETTFENAEMGNIMMQLHQTLSA